MVVYGSGTPQNCTVIGGVMGECRYCTANYLGISQGKVVAVGEATGGGNKNLSFNLPFL